MNKKLVLSLLTIAVFVAAVQLAEPASATTLIDSGSKSVLNPNTNAKSGTFYYKTWNKGNYLHTYVNGFLNGYGQFFYGNIYMKKVSSTQLKVSTAYKFFGGKTMYDTVYYSTSKTATYWYKNTGESSLRVYGAREAGNYYNTYNYKNYYGCKIGSTYISGWALSVT